MTRLHHSIPVVVALLTASAGAQQTATSTKFNARDVFELEWVSDPQISPDGRRVIFGRTRYDIMTDVNRSALWIANSDGSDVRALLSPERQVSSPRWSPDGGRIVFVSTVGGKPELIVRRMASGQEKRLTKLADSPGGLTWSPDGRWIAFTMFVPAEQQKPPVNMITPPKSANWGPPLKYIESLNYRADGEGYVRPGYRHIFVLPADGGARRQVTNGSFDDGAPVWTPDGKTLVFSANRAAEAEYNPLEAEIYDLTLATGAITQLTHRKGPDFSPAVSPDGKLIAYAGLDDREKGYQASHLYVMNRDGSDS
ncbi:MAG: DPP IV N-terminal domain-containing protein, partial [Gemmatimonadota bacterium]|nr:DPP IV N-terminal domain-containing protein [Gemmatimonadota bacterium]